MAGGNMAKKEGIVSLPSANEIVKMFLKFSSIGYASGAEPLLATEQNLLGIVPNNTRVFTFNQGEWTYYDVYFVGVGGRSGGSTLLTFAGNPVFSMSYNGRVITETCQKLGIDPHEVTQFLRLALQYQYQGWEEHGASAFVGGRGPRIFPYLESKGITTGNLQYYNEVSSNDLRDFHGCEWIIVLAKTHKPEDFDRCILSDDVSQSDGAERIFYHRYQGGLLVPAE